LEKKTIWYISKYASPIKYHFGTRHFYFSEQWAKQGHDSWVFTSNSFPGAHNLPQFKSKYFYEKINGVQTVWLNTFRTLSSNGIRRIISWIHFEWKLLIINKKKFPNPDVIIVSSLSLLTILNGILLKKRYKARLIFEIRDIWPLSLIILGNYSKNNLFIKFLAWVEKKGYEVSDQLVGTMPNFCEHASSVTHKAAPCACIPQGVSLDFYERENVLLDEEYILNYIPKDKFIICYIGTINVNNPIDSLIDAAYNLQHMHDLHFLILGSGNRKLQIMEKAKNLKNVSFPPTIDKKKVLHFLSFTDLCFDAFESQLAKYGLSRNKWIDYMYAGKPIICYFSGFKSMINEAEAGSFVDFGDIEGLSKEISYYYSLGKEATKEIGEKGKAWLIANRTFEKLARDYEKFF
jgi:Glycosyl transferases group 1